MRIGLLWFDDDKSVTLTEKISQAAQRYRERFGRSPSICYVHPNEEVVEGTLAGLTISPLTTVLRHHLLICHEEQASTLSAAA